MEKKNPSFTPSKPSISDISSKSLTKKPKSIPTNIICTTNYESFESKVSSITEKNNLMSPPLILKHPAPLTSSGPLLLSHPAPPSDEYLKNESFEETSIAKTLVLDFHISVRPPSLIILSVPFLMKLVLKLNLKKSLVVVLRKIPSQGY